MYGLCWLYHLIDPWSMRNCTVLVGHALRAANWQSSGISIKSLVWMEQRVWNLDQASKYEQVGEREWIGALSVYLRGLLHYAQQGVLYRHHVFGEGWVDWSFFPCPYDFGCMFPFLLKWLSFFHFLLIDSQPLWRKTHFHSEHHFKALQVPESQLYQSIARSHVCRLYVITSNDEEGGSDCPYLRYWKYVLSTVPREVYW